jgi:hypothetical protein
MGEVFFIDDFYLGAAVRSSKSLRNIPPLQHEGQPMMVLEPLERLRFFSGRLLSADDL